MRPALRNIIISVVVSAVVSFLISGAHIVGSTYAFNRSVLETRKEWAWATTDDGRAYHRCVLLASLIAAADGKSYWQPCSPEEIAALEASQRRAREVGTLEVLATFIGRS